MNDAPHIIREPQAAVDFLLDKTVAVLGYGAQGHAHALNLRDSGCRVIVGQRPGGTRHAQAVEAGFEPVGIGEAAERGDLLIFALPDEATPEIYEREIAPHLKPGRQLGFIHGYNIHYRCLTPPEFVDVLMVAPKAQGHGLRRAYEGGGGVFGLIAVEQDATGTARKTALAWAAGLGCARAGILETTFKDETETDLFGEQAVLCGGLTGLIKAAFETLVEAGYPPALAYFECCHEIKLIADLIHEGGITHMRERISNTARFGDLTRGPRVIDDDAKQRMRQILEEIRSGRFAADWQAEAAAGKPEFDRLTDQDRQHAIEQIGAFLRTGGKPPVAPGAGGAAKDDTG